VLLGSLVALTDARVRAFVSRLAVGGGMFAIVPSLVSTAESDPHILAPVLWLGTVLCGRAKPTSLALTGVVTASVRIMKRSGG
jgi:hypothetical protein